MGSFGCCSICQSQFRMLFITLMRQSRLLGCFQDVSFFILSWEWKRCLFLVNVNLYFGYILQCYFLRIIVCDFNSKIFSCVIKIILAVEKLYFRIFYFLFNGILNFGCMGNIGWFINLVFIFCDMGYKYSLFYSLYIFDFDLQFFIQVWGGLQEVRLLYIIGFVGFDFGVWFCQRMILRFLGFLNLKFSILLNRVNFCE